MKVRAQWIVLGALVASGAGAVVFVSVRGRDDAASATSSATELAAPAPSTSSSAAPSPTASAIATATASALHAPAAVPPLEARRRRISRLEDDPTLLAAAEAVKKRFGGKVPAALDVQIADRPGGRGRAVFAVDATKPGSGDAIAIAADASGAIEWTKDRPTAGIMPPAGPFALAAREAGRIELAVCDPPTKRVALRVWDADGNPFADFDAMDIEDCAAISLLHWPRIGEVIVASRPSSTRAQLVTSSGALAWHRGLELGARTKKGMPASLASDTPESFVVVQLGPLAGGADAPDHVLAFRYDRSGAGLWSKILDLGEAPKARTDVEDRLLLARPKAATVRVSVPKSGEIDVTSEGIISKVVK